MRTIRAGLVLLAALALPLVVWAEGASFKDFEKEVKAALEKKDVGRLDELIQAIRAAGGKEAAELLIKWAKKIPPGEEVVYWRLVSGAAALFDADGLAEVGKEILEKTPFSRDLLYALQNNRGKHVPEQALGPVLEKGPIDMALLAADQLSAIDTIESVDVLIAGLEKHEKKSEELAARITRALCKITAADCGSASDWKKWWAGQRSNGLEGRKESGKSTGTVVDHMEGNGYDEAAALEKLPPGAILVMTTDCKRDPRGVNFDDISGLLTQMNIPHTNVTKQDFDKGKVDLKGVVAILLTCTQINEHCVCPSCVPGGGPTTNRMTSCTGCDKHDIESHKLTADSVKRIREWVEAGGYLFTEDWGLADLIEPAWPKILKQGKMLTNRSARVNPARGQTSHPLLRGVFVDPQAAKKTEGSEGGGTVTRGSDEEELSVGKVERFWTIDNESPVIEVVALTKVTVLMASDDLKGEGGPNGTSVAVTFIPSGQAAEKNALAGSLEKMKGGRVLHVLSHFAKQKSDNDAFALQNLLLNFLSEAQRRAPRG